MENNPVKIENYFFSFFREKLEKEASRLPENADDIYARSIRALMDNDLDNGIPCLIDAAEGNTTASYLVAVFHIMNPYLSDVVRTECVDLLKKLADTHYQDAMYALAFYYLADDSPEQDDTLAARWFGEAARAGHPLGMYEYGSCLLAGKGVQKDLTESARWYRKAADAGVDLAQFELGIQLLQGEGVAKDLTQGISYIRKAVNSGHPGAMAALAQLYYDGEGVPEDKEVAYRLYRECYAKGNSKGAYGLARFYLCGEVVGQDYITACWLLIKSRPMMGAAAESFLKDIIDNLCENIREHNDISSYIMLAWLHACGMIGDDKNGTALEMLRRAAQAGDMLARSLLLRYYPEEQFPETASTDECVSFFQEMSEQGHVWAARELALMAISQQIDRSKDEQLELLNRAAELGDLILEHEIRNYLDSIKADEP